MVNQNLSLTVVLPTYNRVEKLQNTLSVYLKSSRKDIEFLIVDNASTDGTEKLVENFILNDSRVRYIKNPVNIGANRSVFCGFMNANAPLIMILPDDDLITSGFINMVIASFDKNKSVGIVHSYLNDSTRIKEANKSENAEQIYVAGEDAVSTIYVYSGGMSGLTFRRSAINYEYWSLDNSIYPQISIACNIATKWDVCLLASKSEYVTEGGQDYTIIQRAKTRPNDYGIIERINILEDVCFQLGNKKIFHKQLAVLLRWGLGCVQKASIANKAVGCQILNALLKDARVRTNILFFISALKNGHFRIIIYLPVIIISPYFWSSVLYYSKRIMRRIYLSQNILNLRFK